MASAVSTALSEALKKAKEAERKIAVYKERFREKYGMPQTELIAQLTELRASLLADEKQLQLNDEQTHRNNEIIKQSYHQLHLLKQQLILEYNCDESSGHNYYLDGEDFRVMCAKYFQQIKIQCLTMKNNFTLEEYWDRIVAPNYTLSTEQLRHIRNVLVSDIRFGLNKNKNKQIRSSVGPIHKSSIYFSNTLSTTLSSEGGLYYVLSWNLNNNIRLIRCEFNQHPSYYKQTQIKIKSKPETCTQSIYEEIALLIKKYMINHFEYDIRKTNVYHIDSEANIIKIPYDDDDDDDDYRYPMGLYLHDSVADNGISATLQEAFDKYTIPLRIDGACNEIVSELLSTTFKHNNNNVRASLILNSPLKAAYIEPKKSNEIMSILGIGAFNKALPRQCSTDICMDSYTETEHRGAMYMDKMISVKYLGELVRLLSLDVFGEKIFKYKNGTILTKRWGLSWNIVAKILQEFDSQNMQEIYRILRMDIGLQEFTKNDGKLFVQLCRVMVNRSADLSSVLLLALLQKTQLFDKIKNKELYVLNQKMFVDKRKSHKCVVGINGFVWSKMQRYQQRMRNTMQKIVNKKIVDKIKIVNSFDGISKGPALAIIAHNHYIQNQQYRPYKKYD